LTIHGNVVVPAGATCDLINIRIRGDLRVGAGATASFELFSPFPQILNGVSGDLTARGASAVAINFASVGGTASAVRSGVVEFDQTTIAKNAVLVRDQSVLLQDTSVSGAASCEGNGSIAVFSFSAAHASGQCAPPS
jgi:hypothetical protein